MIFHYLVEQKGYAGPSQFSLQLCVRSFYVQHRITLLARVFLVARKSVRKFGGVAGLPVIENHLVSDGNATKATNVCVCVFLLSFFSDRSYCCIYSNFIKSSKLPWFSVVLRCYNNGHNVHEPTSPSLDMYGEFAVPNLCTKYSLFMYNTRCVNIIIFCAIFVPSFRFIIIFFVEENPSSLSTLSLAKTRGLSGVAACPEQE